jgi:hypothetical protein
MSFFGGTHVFGFLFKFIKGYGLFDGGFIGNGAHFTRGNTPGVPAAKIADMGDLIVDLYGTNGAKRFTRAAKVTKCGRHFNTAPVCNGDSLLGTFCAIMRLALMADNGKINAGYFNFFYLYSGTQMACFSRMIKGAMGFASSASGTNIRINYQHQSLILSIL